MGKKIGYFISDHGFGHAGRSVAIIEILLQRGTEIKIISSVPIEWFNDALPINSGISIFQIKVDVGVIQLSSVENDITATLSALKEHWSLLSQKEELITNELKSWGAEEVVFNITALAPRIASKLGIPSIGISNFTWEFIYEPFININNEFKHYIQLHSDSYRLSTALIKAPYSCNMDQHQVPIFEIPWYGRKGLNKMDARKKIGLNITDEIKILMYSFGGHNFKLDTSKWDIPENWRMIWVDNSNTLESIDRVLLFNPTQMKAKGIAYLDLICASDVVVCKTGFGVVSEIILNNIPAALFTDRPGFVEHAYLAKAMKENVNCTEIELELIQNLDKRLFKVAETVLNYPKKNFNIS